MKQLSHAAVTLIVIVCILAVLGVGVLGFYFYKKSLVGKIYTGTVSEEQFDPTAEYYDSNKFVTLETKADGSFVILNLTDIHQSDVDYRAFTGALVRNDIKRMVSEIKPDLITVSGDITCADSEVKSIQKFTDLMNSFGIPWAPIFGNHDGESGADKNYLADVMTSGNPNYCLLKKGPSNFDSSARRGGRVGNYVINIVEKGTGKLAQSLIMVDTASSHLCSAQIEWYKQVMRTLKRDYGNPNSIDYSEINSTMIMHIPLAEYFYAYTAHYDESTGKWDIPGAYGDCQEGDIVACEKISMDDPTAAEHYQRLIDAGVKIDAELMEVLRKKGLPKNNGLYAELLKYHTENVLCGHDHLNWFFCPYYGVNLMYATKIGYGSGWRNDCLGGTVLTVANGSMHMEQYTLKNAKVYPKAHD